MSLLISHLTLPLSHLAPVSGFRNRKCLSLYCFVIFRYCESAFTGHKEWWVPSLLINALIFTGDLLHFGLSFLANYAAFGTIVTDLILGENIMNLLPLRREENSLTLGPIAKASKNIHLAKRSWALTNGKVKALDSSNSKTGSNFHFGSTYLAPGRFSQKLFIRCLNFMSSKSMPKARARGCFKAAKYDPIVETLLLEKEYRIEQPLQSLSPECSCQLQNSWTFSRLTHTAWRTSPSGMTTSKPWHVGLPVVHVSAWESPDD